MKQLFVILILALLPLCSSADNRALYEKLDSTLAHRNDFVENKEKKLKEIKLGARYVTDSKGKLRLYESLANGYMAYIYDSAMVYTQKGQELAQQSGHQTYYNKLQLIRTKLLISRGFYAEAKEILDHLDIPASDKELSSNYHYIWYMLYNNWEAYCEKNEFSNNYRLLKLKFIAQAIKEYPRRDAMYYFIRGEQAYFSHAPSSQSTYYYNKVLNIEQPSSRIYAMSAFALSEIYEQEKRKDLQEYYLIEAAISDLKSATKENVALQDVALFLYQNKSSDLKKAQEYINISLEDAAGYNNRLRRLEVSSKLQLIMTAYTQQIKTRNIWLIIALTSILILLLGVVVSSIFIRKKNQLLNQKQELLGASAKQMSQLNQQLETINQGLKDTNQKRESLVKVYIDLCYNYIERISKLRTLAIRKIKANQCQELLSTLSSSKTSEQEKQDFFQQFDQAFLALYPSFVRELNELLVPGGITFPTKAQEMTPILRVAALIRLGITESSKIAGILSYSPQTIYNYRSTLKNNALDKEHFEEKLQKICTVITLSTSLRDDTPQSPYPKP